MSTSRVPVEILGYIFTLLVHDHCGLYQKWDWIVLAHVCHLWRSIALSTPRVWSLISKFHSKERVERQLKLSKNVDLSVFFRQEKEIRNSPDILSIVLEHMPRISQLRIDAEVGLWTRYFRMLKRSPAPRLKSICVKIPDPENVIGSIVFTAANALFGVGLESIYMKRLQIPTDIPPLENLTRLTLEDNSMPILRLRCLFEECQKLEYISLKSVKLARPNLPAFEPRKIQLPHLHDLLIQDIPLLDISMLFQDVVVPVKLNSDISCSFAEKFEDNMFSFLLNGDLLCDELLISVASTAMVVQSTSFYPVELNSGTILNHIVKTKLCLTSYTESFNFFDSVSQRIKFLIERGYWKYAKLLQIDVEQNKEKGFNEDDWVNILLPLKNVESIQVLFFHDSTVTERGFAKAIQKCVDSEKNTDIEIEGDPDGIAFCADIYIREFPSAAIIDIDNLDNNPMKKKIKLCPSLKNLHLYFNHFSLDHILQYKYIFHLRKMYGVEVDISLRDTEGFEMSFGSGASSMHILQFSGRPLNSDWDGDESVERLA